jgi:hypothetical protein
MIKFKIILHLLPLPLLIHHFCRHFGPFQLAIPFQIHQTAPDCDCLFHTIGKVNCGFIGLQFGSKEKEKSEDNNRLVSNLHLHGRQVPNVTYQRPGGHHLYQILKIALLTGIPKGVTKAGVVFHCNWINCCIDLQIVN